MNQPAARARRPVLHLGPHMSGIGLLVFKNSLLWRVFSDTDRALLGKHNSLQTTTAVLMTTSQLRTRALALAVAVAAAGLHGAAMGAPASSQELNGTADASAPADTAGARRATPGVPATITGVPQSRTVELLLQMQDKPDFAGGDASRSSATDAGRRSTASGTSNPGAKSAGNAAGTTDAEGNPLANLKATVLGSSAQNAGADNTGNREPARPADMGATPVAGPAGPMPIRPEHSQRQCKTKVRASSCLVVPGFSSR